MNIKVYANYEGEKVLNESDYKKLAEVTTQMLLNDRGTFAQWLYNNYDSFDVWTMTAEERARAEKEFEEYVNEQVVETLCDEGWNELELSI